MAQRALAKAHKNPNFSTLIWPHDFLKSGRRFHAVVLAFVIQTMPRPEERATVIRAMYKKLTWGGYILYMSRYGQITTTIEKNKVSDGYFMSPQRSVHSFYREFTTEETRSMMEIKKIERRHSWSARGTEQVFLYQKVNPRWI